MKLKSILVKNNIYENSQVIETLIKVSKIELLRVITSAIKKDNS